MHDFMTPALECHQNVGVAVLAYDFSKTFDRLGHDIIIRFLHANNFPTGFIYWIPSFLSNRTQTAKVQRVSSHPLSATSGVPQGSIFGPYLFNAVVGSINPVHSSSKVIKYTPMTVRTYFYIHKTPFSV